MAKRKEITASFYIGDQKVDKLPEEYLEKMSKNLSETMSIYYRAHPDQFRAWCESDAKEAANPTEATT